MNADAEHGPSLLERIDVALAGRFVRGADLREPLAAAQGALDRVRQPAAGDPAFLAGLLRLRGFVVTDGDAAAVLADRPGRFAAVTQEHRLIHGLADCLRLMRARARDGQAPDGAFMVELWRTMTAELPRFRGNDLRQGPPWDAVLYVNYPRSEELRHVLDTFDAARCFRDHPAVFRPLHPVRQGFRLLWRFARIAPFPDFNLVMAWLALNCWLQVKGYPLLVPEQGDQGFLARLVGGPPPTRIVQFEARLLDALVTRRDAG